MNKLILPITILMLGAIQLEGIAEYWLVIGTYRQGPGGKPNVSGMTNPTINAIPMLNEQTCLDAGNKISQEIYSPVWQFDNKWTCIYSGK